MNLQKIDIHELLPQQEPFVMVDKLTYFDEKKTSTTFTVREDNLFVEDGRLNACALAENIAQTCATHIGYLSRHLPIRIGVVASVKNVEIISLPKVGAHLETTVEEQGEPIFSVSIYDAKVFSEGTLVAQGEMRVVLTDQIPTEQ